MLAFIDLETTGTDDRADKILEIGCIVVDEETLTEQGVRQLVINPGIWPKLAPIVLDMHTRNGLFKECNSSVLNIMDADKLMIEFFTEHSPNKRLTLAGSGVGHFDSRFIRNQMPLTANCLTYYVLDTGVIRRAFEMANRRDLLSRVRKPHRALDDARLHLDEWRKYRELINQIPIGG